MPTFFYKAKTETGLVVEGTAEAMDKFDLAKSLKQKGEIVIFTKEKKAGVIDLEKLNLITARIKLREKIMFTRNLSSMIDAGISVSRALEILERQTKNPKLKKILHEVLEDIRGGETLSGAMKKHEKIFTGILVAMVRAGEESGKLSESLRIVGTQLERNYVLRKKVKGAMMYPTIVIFAMVIIAILMFIYVVPTITATFKEFDMKLPLSTRFIMAISDFLVSHTIAAFVSIFGVVAGVFFGLKTKRGKRVSDFVVLHLPGISPIVKQYNAAQTARTLSSLFTAGVSVVQSLEITRDVVQNSYFKAVLLNAEDVVQKGIPISSAFLENSKIYPSLLGEMMQVGEETGKLSEMLERISTFYEEEVDTVTKDLSTIIEPILMLFIGTAVGFFALSMIAPMYAITSSI